MAGWCRVEALPLSLLAKGRPAFEPNPHRTGHLRRFPRATEGTCWSAACRSELDARGRQAYAFRVETKLKSEIPV